MSCSFIFLSMFFLFSGLIASNTASDTVDLIRTVIDGDTIVSSGGSFEMGFFSPGKSKNRYLGIWYKTLNVTTPVWVANRETPLADFSGVLTVRKPGILVLINSTRQIVWSSNISESVQNPVAQLLDSGNLVVKNAGEENPKNFLWQSFDYPGNTFIAGMKLGKNFETGREWYLSSWKSEDDPSPGDYKYSMDTRGYPQLVLWTGKTETYRSGAWIGDRLSGAPKLKPNIIYKYNFMFTKEEVNCSYVVLKSSSFPRRVLSPDGLMQWWTWAERKTDWVSYSKGPPIDACDNYASCGAYGICNVDNSPICGCLDKFVARNPGEYNLGDWLNGCERKTPLDCGKGDIFLPYSQLKLPDTRNVWFNSSMTLEECRVMCLGNCSCMAYSNMNFTGEGSGCFLWFGDVMDIRQLGADGQDVYLRMASSESGTVLF